MLGEGFQKISNSEGVSNAYTKQDTLDEEKQPHGWSLIPKVLTGKKYVDDWQFCVGPLAQDSSVTKLYPSDPRKNQTHTGERNSFVGG